MPRVTNILGILSIALLIGTTAAAQEPAAGAQGGGGGRRGGGPPPAPPKNLQVLPKDMTTPQVLGVMRPIASGLGVTCAYCHIWEQGSPNNDLASDSKTPKLVARVMMQMTADINAKLAANIQKPADQIVKVECATCHRGSAIPVNPPPPAPPARGGGGAPAAAPAAQ